MFAPVYLDYNASTPLDERVLEAMLPFLRERFGNASSRHEYGRHARNAIDVARQQVAAAVGAQAGEVVFASGGSEANNLFVKGAAAAVKAGTIAIGATEHPCVREPALQLRGQGWQVLTLPVDASGALAVPEAVAMLRAIRPQLLSVMLANNETGVINAVGQLSPVAKEIGALLHTDAVQALGKLKLDFRGLGVDAMSLSSHKIGGPIGVGALLVRRRVDLTPLIAGGGHERGLRSGTENVAGIVGFGLACELAVLELETRRAALQEAKNLLDAGLVELGARLFGQGAERLPNTTYFAFEGIDGETLVGKLDRAGYALASGAACSSANPEPSRTLLAMGVAPDLARCAVRASLGPKTQSRQIEDFLAALRQTLTELKQLTAVSA